MSQGESLNVWFVRDAQGGRYGPIDFMTLKVWVREGRVGPANEVSRNGTDWFPAAQQHGLGMDWVAEIGAGSFYGPIHREAMLSLIGGGSVARHAPLFHRFDGDADSMTCPQSDDDGRAHEERERLERELEQALAKATAASKGQHNQMRVTELQGLRQTLEAQAREVETHLDRGPAGLNETLRIAQERVEELETRLTQGEREWASAVRRFEGHAARLQTQVQTLQADALVLEQERQRLLDEVAECGQYIAQVEAASEASRQEAALQCDALEMKANDLAAKLSAVQTALEEQRRLTERERSRYAGLQESAEAVRRERDEARQEVERLRRAAPPPREVLEAEVLPPERPAAASRVAPPPDTDSSPASPLAKSARGGEGGKAAPSLADLERQARLELERLGAQGHAFFAKKK